MVEAVEAVTDKSRVLAGHNLDNWICPVPFLGRANWRVPGSRTVRGRTSEALLRVD